MKLQDGKGKGQWAGVNTEGDLQVRGIGESLQHHISVHEENAYQVISVDTGITAKTQTLLHIKNTSTTKFTYITFIRMQAITNTASKPVIGEYFQIGLGDTVSSGGTAATPVNMNASSGNTASVTATGIDPTMAGTFTEIDRIYHQASGDEYVFNKEGSIVLGQGDTISVRLVSAGTGEAKCRISFLMEAPLA